MSVTLNIGVDLGSDCFKIAYAYELNGKINYGKLEKESFGMGMAMPAVAFYNAAENKWLFGDQVDASAENSFITVVKIKSLLSLLLYQNDEKIRAANREFYHNKNYFPKFYFPVRRKIKTDFAAMVEDDAVFVVPGKTPHDVCRDFFCYAAEMVKDRISALSDAKGIEFDKRLKITLVHPSKTGNAYIKELCDLVKLAFGVEPCKMLSSTKALSMYAYERKMIKNGESLLMFDMGEEDISVAKAMLMSNSKLAVDGADGHSAPLDLGGNDVDDAIAAYIETGIAMRETMGTPSYGTEGHITERGLHSKQYLFLKDIKKAKRILSMPLKSNSVFKNGVPVALSRDVYIQRNLSKEEFSKCVGVADDSGTALRIADYIITELGKPVNSDVTKVFVSGGVVETYGLLDYLKQKIAGRYNNIQLFTFDDNNNDNDGFNVLSYEDSVYAPALGGAMVALKNYDVKTIVSLSYATWVNINGSPRVLEIFLNKGEVLPNEKIFYYITFAVRSGEIFDEMYSTIITESDIEHERYKEQMMSDQYITPYNNSDVKALQVGDSDSSKYRKKLKQVIGLKTVGGDSGAKIQLFYNNRQINFQPGEKIRLAEGLVIDEEGSAMPYIINVENLEVDNGIEGIFIQKSGLGDSGKVKISKLETAQKEQEVKGETLLKNRRSNSADSGYVGITYLDTGMTERVPACLIKPRFKGMGNIELQAND